jgi:prepilin-type N-terminal cleavage/methylation domain-containing protein
MRLSMPYHQNKYHQQGLSTVVKQAQAGMTLIEMLVVLVILAIAAVLAAPNASRWIESYTVRKAGRQLVSDLQLAKLKTISQGVQHRIQFDPANKSYEIQRYNAADGTWPRVDAPRLLSSDENNPYYASGVALANNFNNNTVTFSTTGTVSPAGTVTLTTTNFTKLVTVILTGRIHFQ